MSIPNCAWTPISELQDDRHETREPMAWWSDGERHATTTISISHVKFRWIELNAEVPASGLVAEMGEEVAI